MSVRPETIAALQDAVRGSRRLCARGGGTKSAVTPDAEVVDLGAFASLVHYVPEECVFTAGAATPLADLERLLHAHGQYLPFDPPFAAAGATIGGTVAAGVSGPRRYRYGGVRDFLIGVRVVDGEGRHIRSGGQVVKNAAGFLLHHGMVGSGGRFGILTEVTFKVFPAPEARRLIRAACGDVADAFERARRLETQRFDCEAIDFDAAGVLTVTLAGRQSAMNERVARLVAALDVPSVDDDGHTADPTAQPFDSMASTADPTLRGSLIKVVGLIPHWAQVRHAVTHAHFFCAGAVAWLTTDDLPRLAHLLEAAGVAGHVIRGPGAGQRVGRQVVNLFEERVRRVLDPHGRFCAASDPCH